MALFTDTKISGEDEDEEELELVRLTNINVVATGLVDRAANRATFFALKREAPMADEPRTKQAPSAEMTDDELRAAQKVRSEEYGIEVVEDAALTFPEDMPTDLELYADPVNLAYPVDTEERAQNARVRFKQFADEGYSTDESKVVVHERIVRAELAFDIVPSFDPEDKLDALLSDETKAKLEAAEKAEAEPDAEKVDPDPAEPDADAPAEPVEAAEDAEPAEMVDDAAQEPAQMAELSAADHLRDVISGMEAGAPVSEEQILDLESVVEHIESGSMPAKPAPSPPDQESESEQMATNDPAEMSDDAAMKSGRPQFSKARMGELMAAYDALGKVLESVNAMAADEMAGSQKAAGPDIEELTAALAAKDEALAASTAEVVSLKAAVESSSRRAAPPATFGVEGRQSVPPKPQPKRLNPLNMRIGQD